MQRLNQRVQRIQGIAWSPNIPVLHPAHHLGDPLPPNQLARLRTAASLADPVAGSSFPVPYWSVPGRISQYCLSLSPAPTGHTGTPRRSSTKPGCAKPANASARAGVPRKQFFGL